jgi:glycerophosphoryl diester phosphodiesterase
MTDFSPRIIAHRGASGSCPENTLAAFDQALAEGAEGLEFDVQLTRDDVPVVFHDHTLRKLGQRRQRLRELSHAQVRALDFGGWFDPSFTGEPIPTLAEVLARYAPKTELCLELKPERDPARNAELLRLVLEQLQSVDQAACINILCFDAKLLQMAQAQAGGLRYVLNALGTASALQQAAHMPWLYAVDVDIRWLRPSAGEQLRAGGRTLMSYTCNTEAHLRAAQAAGVHYIITNYPARMRGWLGQSTPLGS